MCVTKSNKHTGCLQPLASNSFILERSRRLRSLFIIHRSCAAYASCNTLDGYVILPISPEIKALFRSVDDIYEE